MGNQKQNASKGTHYSETLRSRDRRRERHDSQGHCAQGDKKAKSQEGHQEGYKEASCQEDSQEASRQEDSQEASEKESSQEEGDQEVNEYQQGRIYLPVFVGNQVSCAPQKVSVCDDVHA